MKNIIIDVEKIIGSNPQLEDAIILRQELMINFNVCENIILDFHNVKNLPTTFFYSLITPICKEYYSKVNVINLKDSNNYNLVVKGTMTKVPVSL